MAVSLPLNDQSGLPLDPTTMQALQQQQMLQNVAQQGGSARARQDSAGVGLGLANLFPSPQVQQAQQVQNALKQAQVSQNPGESDLDFSIRQLKAQHDAVAPYSPESAMQLQSKITALANQKFEQQKLMSEDARANEREADSHATAQAALPGLQAAGQFSAATKNIAYAITPDQQAELGYTTKAYSLDDPQQVKALQAAAQGGAQIMSSDRAAQLFTSSNTADMRLAGELAKAKIAAGGDASGQEINQLAVESIFDPSALSRVPGAMRVQIAKAKVDAGVLPTDEAQAKLEYKAMQTAVGRAGAREGNMKTLENSMSGLGQQVTDALSGVTRTDWVPLNAAIRAGKTQFSDAGESRYAVAVQSLVSDYARVIAGGTGVSSDKAKDEAWSLLSKNAGPAGIKAAVDQMSNRETSVITGASAAAVEMLAKPSNYPTLTKIQRKMGFFQAPQDADVAAATGSPVSPPAAPPAAPANGDYRSLWTK